VYSYEYAQGNWSVIEDPLHGMAIEGSVYTGKNPPSELSCFGLPFYVHSYDSSLKQPKIPKYKFCCVLDIRPAECHIWVPDLPDLLQLLQHMQPIGEDIDFFARAAHRILLGKGALNVRFVPDF
jgi:hypothetical protein